MFDMFFKKMFVKQFDKMLGNQHKPLESYDVPKCPRTASEIFSQMTEDEKIRFISGKDSFAIGGIPRLGVPDFWMSDATSGIRGWDASVTVFPAGVAMAASWNRWLAQQSASRIADEARALGITVLLGPGVNIARVPTCGRNFEYMGEDPYLAGEIAFSYVQGAQSHGVITTVKHFACNNSDYDRHKSNSIVDERTLNEIYFPAFKKALIKGGSLGIMTSYNLINGEYASQNKYSVGEVLRKRWGFKGMTVSDWNSLYDTVKPLKCGVDIEMPSPLWFSPEKVKKALSDGLIEQSDIDFKVLNILNALEKIGALARPVADKALKTGSPEAIQTARSMACESITLLRNDDSILPLCASKLHRIVIAGSMSAVPPTGGGGSSFIHPRRPAASLQQELESRIPGLEVETKLDRDADVTIIETGFSRLLETEAYERPYSLPAKDIKLIRKASGFRKKVIVIVHSGGDYETSSWSFDVPAIINAYYLGETSSQALCDVLLGDACPSGKLPFSMALRYSDYLSVHNYARKPAAFSLMRVMVGQGNPKRRKITNTRYEEGLKIGYRQFDTEGKNVAFPFGHGLSYTSFGYRRMTVAKTGDEVIVKINVTNDGKVRGSETVQLYVHNVNSRVFHPDQELKGFEKVTINPGEDKDVEFHLGFEDFSYFDSERHGWKVDRGRYTIRLGSSSQDRRQEADIDY